MCSTWKAASSFWLISIRVDISPTASRSWWLWVLRLATAFSSCTVPAAVCDAAWRMSCMPCVTCSKPICCWLVAPMICWKACTLSCVVSAMRRMVCSVTSACCLPASARLTASSVSMTELLMPFLDVAQDRADLHGRFLGLVGQVLDLVGDDREAVALLAGAGRLDRGVQGQQVRALGDVVDRGDDLADRLRLLAQGDDVLGDLLDLLADRFHGAVGFLHGLQARPRWSPTWPRPRWPLAWPSRRSAAPDWRTSSIVVVICCMVAACSLVPAACCWVEARISAAAALSVAGDRGGLAGQVCGGCLASG